MPERHPLIILGRTIGTYNGWDELEDPDFFVYEFEPAPSIPIPACDCLIIQYSKGTFEQTDNGGDAFATFDIIETLANIPKDTAS